MSRPAKDEAADIQGLVRTGYGSLKGARYLLLRIGDAERARPWLRSLSITTVEDCRSRRQEQALQIAFTAEGLRKLGLDDDVLEDFVPQFLDGMAGDESRSRRLGDVGPNAPEHWEWGAGDKEPHILLMLFATCDAIAGLEAKLVAEAKAAGCDVIANEPASDMGGKEPFGFADGLSQPKMDWDDALRPGGSKDRDYRHQMVAGEVLLGHGNEYKFVAHYPEGSGLGRNGSYIAYRQHAQDVTGFWQWLRETAGEENSQELAERMVGRRIDGCPLPDLAELPGAYGRNAFTFANDPDGQVCPIGSHIRRANPRLGDHPAGNRDFLDNLFGSMGFVKTPMHDAAAPSRFHRLLRRGRPYGDTIPPKEAMKPDAAPVKAGLHFLCLNASLARQFEFVQNAWIASSTFAGLTGEQDPLLGDRQPARGGKASDGFSYLDKDRVPRRLKGIPQFVTVKGGAYFFMPGINGLRQILA